MKVWLTLLILYQCLNEIVSGVLQPEVADSVLPYRNNENAVGKYTFTFKMSSPVPSSPRVTIDFPPIYTMLLSNVDNCQGTVFVKLLNEKVQLPCSLIGNQFIFDLSSNWSELDSGNIVIEIFDIVNPPSVQSQSTGFFQVRTWSGVDIVIDSNMAFDSIAFAPAYTLFSAATLTNDGSNIAGYTTNYILQFTTAYSYPTGSWFRMKFPDGFAFESALHCYITNIDPLLSELPCYNDGQVLIMKNLLTNLVAGVYKIKMRNVINPKIASSATGNFIFESLKEGVFTVMEYTSSIAGVAIKPGTITDVTVIGFPLVQNLYVDYTITYKPANSVPRGGKFNIQFPPNFIGGIDTSCRVISGLLPADDSGLVCVTNGIRDIYITNFQDFTSQYIQVKCYAYNPPVAGETANFQVRSFTTTAATQIIDENVQAGTVVISSIEKPNFMEIDFYKKHINCSFYQDCPINFRYFPYPNNTLSKATSTTDYSAIDMMMPIWWLMMNGGRNSTYPEILYESVPAASTHQHMHVASMITPLSQGYGACETPVTINNVKVSPIPGRFPFRIWTYKSGSKYHGRNGYNPTTAYWYKTPVEQDTYIMDIPITGIAVLQTWTSSNDLADPDNLLHLRSNVHPFLFAWSGTVTVIITHVENSLEDKAEWPRYAGQGAISDNSYKELACKLYQSGSPTGYLASWWNTKNLRCLMKSGDYSIKEPTQIQVSGFDSNIDKGNYYEMYIPDMKYCVTINRQCKILYTYTMTEDTKFPYRVSQREQTIGVVKAAPAASAVQTAVSSGWGTSGRSSNRRCEPSYLSLYIRPERDITYGDYILIKRNIDHWNLDFLRNDQYSFTLYSTPNYVGNLYPILNFEKNQEYLVHRFLSTVTLAVGVTYELRINNFVTSPYPNNVAWTDIIIWPGHTKRTNLRMGSTAVTALNDGLALSNQGKSDLFGSQPWTHKVWWQPYYTNFRICMGVPAQGEVIIKYSTNLGPMNSPVPVTENPLVCRVWQPVRFYKANQSEVDCNFDQTNNRWVIKNFYTIPMRTYLKVHWYFTYGASMSTVTYNAQTYNASGNAATMMDYYNNNVNVITDATGAAQTKANSWEYVGHFDYKWELYQGGAGAFVFEIETGDNMQWEPTESYVFRFTISNTVQINNGRLECRYAEKNTITGKFGHHFPSVECGLLIAGATVNTFYMKMHPNLKIISNNRYQVFLDTRSTDTNDGLTFSKYGIYSINVESYNGGTKLKGGKQRYEVFGPRIPHFFIWSSNKIAGEKTFYSYYIDFMNNQGIMDSDPTQATYDNFILYFDTVAPGGYPMDLGMGYPDQSQIPCNIILPTSYWTNVNTAICTLYYGYSDAPAKIKFEGFRAFSRRVFRLDVPLIQNPTATGVVPRTWLKIFRTTGAGAAKTSTVIWEGRYYELNTTWVRNTTRYAYSANTITDQVTQPSVATKLGVTGDLMFTFRTPQTLHGNDFVLIKFPIFWPTPYSISDPAYCKGFPLSQERCYSIRNDPQDAHFVYFQLSGALANGAAISFTVPSSRAVVPITNATTAKFTLFLYHDTRLIATQTYGTFPASMFIPDPIVPTINCLPTSAIQSTENEYIVRFTLPHNLLDKSEIRIDYVDYDLTANPNCTSTTNSQLTGSVRCSILPTPDTFASIIGFNAIAMSSIVEIKLSLLNRLPAVPATRMWRVRTYYLRGGYYYLNGDSMPIGHVPTCNVVAMPAVVNVPWPTWFHKFERTRYNQYGPLNLIFESAYTLTASTPGDYVLIRIPTTFVFAKAEKVASWEYHYPYLWDFKIVGANHEIKVWAPKTVNIDAGTRYRLNLTTLNALGDVNGILYPDQISTHYFANIEVYKGGVLVEQGDAKVFVFKPNFPLFEAKSYLMNSNQKAAFRMQFTTGVAGTYGANSIMMKFKLPTATYKYRQRINLFADDAGTGLIDGATINCQLILPTFTLLNTYCLFYKGSQDLGLPATVELYAGGSIALAVGTVYTAVFDGFRHPNVGDDDKNVEPSLEFYSAAGVHTYTGIDYDYTIIEDLTYTASVITGYPSPGFDSSTVGATNMGASFSFISPVALSKYQNTNGIGWADYLIVEFPQGYKVTYNSNTKAKLIAGTGFAASVDTVVEFACGNNWIIWRPNIATISANVMYTLRFSSVDQAKSIPANSTFRMLIVQNREIVRIINYTPITGYAAIAIAVADITFDSVDMPTLAVPAQTIPRNKYQQWSLTFKHPLATIPAGGTIQIVLPAGVFTNIDDHCYNQPTSSLTVKSGSDTIYCKWDTLTNSYIITNIASSPPTDNVKLYFYANSQLAVPGVTSPIVIKAFNDEARSFQILEGQISTFISNSKYGFDQLMFSQEQDEKPDVVRVGESSAFDLEIKIPTSYTTATVITVTFPVGVSVPTGSYLECFFDTYESRECKTTATSPLTITVLAPHSPALTVGSQYKLQFRTRCANNNQKGLTFATAGKFSATVTDGTSTSTVTYEVFKPDFDFIQPRVMHSNAGVTNGIAFRLKINVAVPATGKIRIKLPKYTQSGKYLLWNSMTTPGSYLIDKCIHVTPSDLVPTSGSLTCRYLEDTNHVIFEATGFPAMAASKEPEIVLYDILNTDTTLDSYNVDAIIETLDGSGVVLNQGVIFDVLGFVKISTTTSGPSSSFTSKTSGGVTANTLGQSGLVYTFPSVSVGAGFGSNDQVVFEFTNNYYFGSLANSGSCSAGTYKAYGKYVVFKPSAVLPNPATLCFASVTNPTVVDATPINVYIINSRAFTQLIKFSAPAWTGTPAATVTGTASSLLKEAGSKYRITVDTASTIPPGGSIAFKFATNYVVHAISVISGFPAGSTVAIDTSVSGFVIGVIRTPIKYSKAVNGVAVFDVFVQNPTTTKTLTVIGYIDYSSGKQIFQQAAPAFTMTTTSAALTTCYLGTTTTFSTNPSTALSLSVMTPAAVAVTFNAGTTPGYDMITSASGTAGCYGLPIYVNAPNTLAVLPSITLYHLTIKKTGVQIINAVKIGGDTPINFVAANGLMSVDFGNHDLADLGYGLTNGSYVPCQLKVNGALSDSVCRLSLGSFYKSPGVEVRFFADIASGSTIEIVVSKFYNPITARKIEVRFRYFENWYGSRNDDLVSYTQMFAISDSTVTTATATIALTPAVAQSTAVSAAFTLTATQIGTVGLVFGPGILNNKITPSTTTGGAETYPMSSFDVSNALLGSVITLLNYNLPSAATGASTWTVVAVDPLTNLVSHVKTFTGTTVAVCTPSLLTFTALSKNDATGSAKYNIKWTSPCDFTRQSTIQLKLAAYLTSTAVLSSTLVSGTVSGSYSVTSDGTNIYISGYDYIAAGTVEFEMTVYSTYAAAGATTGSFQALLNGLYIINSAPTTAKLTTVAGLTVDRFRDYIRYDKPVVINGNGYLSLLIKPVSAYSATDVLYLTQSSTTFASTTFYLRCKFTQLGQRDESYLSQYCYFDSVNKQFNIKMPKNTVLSNTAVYRLDIFYYSEQQFGFTYPSLAKDVQFTAKLVAGATIKDEFVTNFQPTRLVPTATCFRNFLSNTALKNVFMLSFIPSMTIPAAGFLEFQFPNTVINQGVAAASFSRLLGYTTYNNQAVKCRVFTVSGTTKTEITASAVSSCLIDFGGNNNAHRYGTVVPKLTAALTSGTTYQFDIYGIDNPTTTNILTPVRVIAGTGATRDYYQIYTDVYHLYTTTPTAAVVETAQNLPTLSPTQIQSLTNVNLPINTALSTLVSADINHIRLVYNYDMMNKLATPLTSAANFETFSVDALTYGLAYFYTNTAQTTNFVLAVQNMRTPASAQTFVSSFQAQIIQQKVIKSTINYNTGTNTFVAIPWTSLTVPVSLQTVKSNDKSPLIAEMTFSKILSKAGSIELYVKNMASVDNTCNEATTLIGASFKCQAVSATTLRISGFSRDIQVGELIRINFRGTTSSLTTGQVCAKAFNDNPAVPTAQSQQVQLETCATLTYTANPGIVWFEARTPTTIRRIQARERGMMTHAFTCAVTIPKLTGKVVLQDLDGAFANIETKDFSCFFTDKNERVAKSCIYYAATKTWEIFAPRSNDLTGTVTLTIVPARQMIEFNRIEGIQMPLIGAAYRLQLQGINAVSTVVFTAPEQNVNLPVPHFTTFNFNSYLIMKDSYSTYNLKITPSTVVNAFPNGIIKIDFKIKNRYALNIFNSDLGTDILNGGVYGCPSASGGLTTTCRLYVGNANTPASILVEPSANLAVGTSYSIDFPALLNPVLNMSEVIMEITSQSLVGANWVNVNTKHHDVFVAQEILVVPQYLPVRTFSDNRSGSPCSVTFSFTMNPAYGPLKSSTTSFDRIVLKVDKAILDILNDQAVAGKVLTCPGYAIKIFDSKDIIELSTTAGIAAGSTVNIACTNFLNQQYVIRGGLKHIAELWIDGTVADAFEYAANTISPHTVITKAVAISAISPEISSFDTYTFTVKPFNYMPVGSRFEIYFDQAFTTITNCEIISGLAGGICQIVQDTAGFDHVKISQYKLWNPDTDPQIVVNVDMTSPPIAGTYAFNFVSYWKEDTVTPSLEDKIDEDILGTITYAGFVPFPYLKLDKMYQFTAEKCPDYYWEGVISFKVALVEPIHYPNYLMVDRWTWVNWQNWEVSDTVPFILGETLCYFDYDNVLFAAKSERCIWETGPTGSNTLKMMVPEELPLLANNNYTIRVEKIGHWERGLSHTINPSLKYYSYMYASWDNGATQAASTSSAPFSYVPRACFFGTRDYTSTNWNQLHNHSLEIIDSTSISYTNLGGSRVTARMQAQLSSHNEIKEVSSANLGWTYLTTENATDGVSCMYWHDQTTLANPGSFKQAWEVGCQVSNTNPTYVDYLSRYSVMTMDNFTGGNYNWFGFRFGFAGKTNHIVTNMKAPGYVDHVDGNRNTFAHLIVQSQTEYEDGIFYDNNRIVRWYHIGSIQPVVTDSTITVGNDVAFSRIAFGYKHVTYTASFDPLITLGGRIWVYWELEHPWWHLTRNETHGSRNCRNAANNVDVFCNQYGVPFRWSIWNYNGISSGSTLTMSHFGLIESPGFAITGVAPSLSKVVKVYIAQENGVNLLKKIRTGPAYVSERMPYYIFEMDDPDNPTNTQMVYRVGIWSVDTYENNTNLIRMWISKDFSTIGPDTTDCKVLFGFRRPNMNQLAPANGPTCKITLNDPSSLSPSPGGYHRVEFYNLYRYSTRWFDQYESWMIFEIKMLNPPTPRWPAASGLTGFWNDQTWPAINESRANYYIRISDDQGRSWVGNQTTTRAHYFRVVRNRLTFLERKQKQGEWAELHMRLYPKNTYPADISKVEIQIPQSYDVPNGGTQVCEVGHDYHTDLDGQFCEISNERKIQVRTNQYFGLLKRCTIVRITTENSVKNNNGFQAPATTAVEDFQTNLYIGSTRIEYTSASGTPEPTKLLEAYTLNISSNVIETTQETTLNVSFHADRAVRAGYDTDPLITDALKKSPQGIIFLKFNTRDTYTSSANGFTTTLAYTAPYYLGGGLPFEVPCQPFKNLKPKSGSSITCTVYPETTVSYYNPVVMQITNFEFISAKQTSLEIHILKLNWIQSLSNQGWIEFSIYEKHGDGTYEKTYDDVRIKLGALANGGVTMTTFTTVQALNPTFIPNIVGSRTSLSIKFSTTVPMFQDDTVEVTMPSMMILPKSEDISAVFKVTPTNVAIPPYNVGATALVYPILSRVNFILPRATAIYGCTTVKPCTVVISTAGFRHVPYEVSTNLQFTQRLISKKAVFQWISYQAVPPPVKASFSSVLVTSSSQFSEDIYVTYTFNFAPSVDYPSGTTLQVIMNGNGNVGTNPTLFDHIDKSNPAATCTTNFANITASCVISQSLVTVVINSTLTESFAGLITVYGMKNPTFVGTTSDKQITIKAIHPIGLRINEDTMNALTYKSKKNIDTISFKMELSSLYQQVNSEYRFILQNTNTLPPKGIINILMPKSWAAKLKSKISISLLIGGFTTSKLIFKQTIIKQPSEDILVQIVPDFEWPSKQKLIVVLDSLINPIGVTTTTAFSVYTQYDSVTIDESDVTDPGSVITLKTYDPKITVWRSEFTPRNEGEIATYNFVVSCQLKILSGQKLQFIFPSAFADILTTYPLKVVCTSQQYSIGACSTASRHLTIPLKQDVQPDDQVDVKVEGIANPNYGQTYFVDVAILDSTDTVIQFISKAFYVETIKGATYFPLSKVTSLKDQILIKSDYEECMSIAGSIPIGSTVILDFPKQFDLKKSTYKCYIGTNHDNTVLTYPSDPNNEVSCTTYPHLKRIEISGQTNSYVHSGAARKICFKIDDIENAKDTGESFHFNMRVFDTIGKKMLYKSAGILNYPSTLIYKRTGLRIFVDDIPDIPIGTMSNDVTITLEKPVPYIVTLTPTSANIEFIPKDIVFQPHEGQKQTFRISPIKSTAKIGTYAISWLKTENNTVDRFSEMVDTYFKVTEKPDYRQLKLTVSQSVYRASVGAESMPIYVSLSHPASTELKLFYKTKKPFQPEFVKFTPESIVFKPGEKVKQFNYKSFTGAVSGLIELQLQPEFSDIYYLPTESINFEVEDVDSTAPNIVEYKITDLLMKSAKLRVSCDESTKVYYICSIKGTITPTVAELKDAAIRSISLNKPRAAEIQGFEFANVTSQTKSFIYYDTYINLEGLIPDTEYTVFMLPQDLTGNNGQVKQLNFKTAPVPPPVTFRLKSSAAISDDKLLQALSLVSGLTTDKIKIIYRPVFSSIPSTEAEVVSVLQSKQLEYEFMIMPDITIDGKTPYDYLKKIEDEKDTLFDELSSLDKTQKISETGKEIEYSEQKFAYRPKMIEVSNFHTAFNVSLFFSGTVYGIILPKNERQPSSTQIKDGLTSVNRQVMNKYYGNTKITVQDGKNYQIQPSSTLNFTFLYHSSEYVAYFIGERDTIAGTQLMDDSLVLSVSVKTLREIFRVNETVVELSIAGLLSPAAALVCLLGLVLQTLN